MNDKPANYRPLPGRGRSWFASYRLYEGPDHVLQVCSNGYSESYKRFYFRDVQAVVLQRNHMRQVWNWIWGGLLGLSLAGWGIGLSALEFDVGWTIFGLIPALLCLVPLAANLLLGPTCSCHIRTAVHFEKLGALRRVRTAEQTLQRIKSLIETTQGPLPPEAFASETLIAPEAPPVVDAPLVAASPAMPAAPPLHHYAAGAHLVLCWLLLADLPVTVLDYFQPELGQALSLVVFAATVVTALIGVARQHRTDLPVMLKRLPWIVLALFGVSIVVAVAYAVTLGIQGKLSDAQDLSVWHDPVLLPITVVTTILSTLLGALGLLEVRRWRFVPPVTPPPLAPPEPPPPAEP